MQSERIVNNLTLLEHGVTLAGDSRRAAELLVDTRTMHLDGLEVGREVGEVIVEEWRREVRVGDVVWPARATSLIKFN